MLKLTVNKTEYEALPEALQSEYKQDGEGYGIQVDGMKTQVDVDKVTEALRKEREDHTATKGELKTSAGAVGGLEDKIKVYESDESKKLSAEDRVEMERLKRENETFATSNADLETKYSGLQGEMTTSTIKAALAKAATGIVRDEAIFDTIDTISNKFVVSDGKVLTNSDMGDKSGLEAKAYLSSFVEERSYLKPQNSGGGSGGAQGSDGGTRDGATAPDGLNCSQDIWNGK